MSRQYAGPWQCLPWSWHIIVSTQCCKRTLARRCSKYWEKKSSLPLHLPVVFVMASPCRYQRWQWLVTLAFAFQVGNLKSALFPVFNWCQFSELRTLMNQPGLCFEDSPGQPFASSSYSHLPMHPLLLWVQALHSCPCVLPENTQRNEILFIFQGGTGTTWLWPHSSWQWWAACSSPPLSLWLPTPLCMLSDVRRSSFHSRVLPPSDNFLWNLGP